MAEYQVGSVANFVSQISNETASKDGVKKNKEILDKLFAASDAATTVEHVPIAPAQKLKKKKRQADDFKITEVAKGKKIKTDAIDEYDEEEVEKILDLPDDDVDDGDETAVMSENVSRRLKKIERKNMKKNATKKGKDDEESDDHVVIVKNLPIKVKRKSIRSLFSQCGKINAVWLRCAALPDAAMPKKVAIIKQDFHPDRQSISAFVRFEEPEAVKKATSLTGTVFQDHHLTVSSISEDAKRELGKGIFIGNLPFGIEDEDLWTHFGDCGPIVDVRIVRDSSNGIGKGFGYVNFQSADSVELAMKLNGSSLNGREIRVERCKNKPKKAKNFGERLNARKTGKGAKDANTNKKSGAYRRIQKKQKLLEKTTGKPEGGWMKSMKQRSKKQAPVQSFAGETTGSDNRSSKPKRLGKAIKQNKEELRKKVIAAKLNAK